MKVPVRPLLLLTALLAGAGCSVVKRSHIRDQWETVDRQQLKRLVVLTHPFPAGDEKVGELWSTLAARQVDLKRNFIIKDKLTKAASEPVDPATLCADGVDGVLWLLPDVKRQGEGVEASALGRLLSCADKQEVWAAEAAGSWSTTEEALAQTTHEYVSEFGDDVAPFVPASYRLLHAMLDTLPNPELTEEEQGEKIENVQ